MAENPGITRRSVIASGAAAITAVAVSDLLTVSNALASTGPTNGIGYFGRFGVNEKLIRDTISAAMSKGADYADVYFQHRVTNQLILEDGSVNRGFANVGLGVGVRAIRGDQTGYGYTEDLTTEGLRRAALTAAAIADGPARTAPAKFRTTEKPNRYPVKVRWEDVRPQQKLTILNSLNEKAFKADERVKKVNLNFMDQGSVILIADSNGRIVEDVQPMTTLSLTVVAEQNGRKENYSVNRAGRADLGFYTPERLDYMVKHAVEKVGVLFDAEQPPAGEMPVVMAAGAAGILLHEAIGPGMDADFNRKGTSIFSDKIGKPVAKPFVSIVDEGTQTGARGSINIDDEGNPVGKTMLVEKGTLTSYLHDSISAKHYGVKPTGNGRRDGYENVPLPRMTSTYMLPGPHTPDEIIASVKKGIYCDYFSNGQVQIGAGDFTFFVKTGYLIEDGKLTKPIKDVNVIGNGPKVLEMIDMVGNDLKIDEGGWTCGKDGQSVPVSQGLPTVRVSSITVGGKAQQRKA
ncbi:MAG TPA: metallopeptidase TldD-related protein [Thermoanaerobaculia bacterium]